MKILQIILNKTKETFLSV